MDDGRADPKVVDAFLKRHVLKWEYALYERVSRKFTDQKRACGLADARARRRVA